MAEVLICSTSDNPHADAIERSLQNRAKIFRINYDRVIREGKGYAISGGNFFIDDISVRDISGVFVQDTEVRIPQDLGENAVDRQFAQSNWRHLLSWLESVTPQATWVNRVRATLPYASVARQLALAAEVGLLVPESCFTNDPRSLRSFAKKIQKRIILKQGNAGAHYEKGTTFTGSIVNPESIDETVLRRSPCLFQEYIEKAYELRIYVIGENVLTCRIDSQQSERAKIDWKNYDLENTPHSIHELDANVKSQVIRLTKKMGLTFGTIDMVVTPDNRHVFLENNSQGHWLWIEKMTGMPITEEISQHLVS